MDNHYSLSRWQQWWCWWLEWTASDCGEWWYSSECRYINKSGSYLRFPDALRKPFLHWPLIRGHSSARICSIHQAGCDTFFIIACHFLLSVWSQLGSILITMITSIIIWVWFAFVGLFGYHSDIGDQVVGECVEQGVESTWKILNCQWRDVTWKNQLDLPSSLPLAGWWSLQATS